MCSNYGRTRCPFQMNFQKNLSDETAKFVLLRYRSEHNHPLDYVAEFGYGPD